MATYEGRTGRSARVDELPGPATELTEGLVKAQSRFVRMYRTGDQAGLIDSSSNTVQYNAVDGADVHNMANTSNGRPAP